MGTITMIAAGKDGVGKSTASVFIGAALAESGESVLLIELDSGQRSIDVISGVYGNLIYDINDVLSGRIESKKAIVQSPLQENLCVLSAPSTVSKLPVENFVKLTTALSEGYDHVLIDVAASPGAVYSAAACAMRAIIVATADPVGVRDAKNLNDRLEEFSIANIRLIVSRLVPNRIYAGIVPNLDYVIDSIGAQLIGIIPETTDIALASAGIAVLPNTSLSADVFRRISERMRGNDLPLLVK